MVSSYVTDSVKPHNRTTAMGYVTACILVGKALGPFISSKVIEKMDGKLIGVTITAFLFDLAAMLALIGTPESKEIVAVEDEEESMNNNSDRFLIQVMNRLNILRSLYSIWNVAQSQPYSVKNNILILISIDLIYEIIISGRANIAVLYPEMKFSWTAVEVGYLQSATAIWRIILLVLLVPAGIRILQRFYHENDEDDISRIEDESSDEETAKSVHGISKTQISIIGGGNFLEVIGYIGYGLAIKGSDYAISYFISTTGVMAKPAVQSGLMNLVPADRVGEFLGSKGVLDGITGLVFSSAGLSFYSYTVSWKPEVIFYVCAVGYSIVVLLSLWLSPKRT